MPERAKSWVGVGGLLAGKTAVIGTQMPVARSCGGRMRFKVHSMAFNSFELLALLAACDRALEVPGAVGVLAKKRTVARVRSRVYKALELGRLYLRRKAAA